MKTILLGMALWSTLCIGGANEEEKDFPALEVMVRNCAHCHNNKNHIGAEFLKAENLTDKETLTRVLKMIEKGKMPEGKVPVGHQEFRKTADGHRLIRWLRSQLK